MWSEAGALGGVSQVTCICASDLHARHSSFMPRQVGAPDSENRCVQPAWPARGARGRIGCTARVPAVTESGTGLAGAPGGGVRRPVKVAYRNQRPARSGARHAPSGFAARWRRPLGHVKEFHPRSQERAGRSGLAKFEPSEPPRILRRLPSGASCASLLRLLGDDDAVRRWFGAGMPDNVAAVLGLADIDEPWAHA